MAARTVISPGDGVPLAALLRADDDTRPADFFARVAHRAAKAIGAGGVHVEPCFVDGALLAEARACCSGAASSLPPPLRRIVGTVERLRAALAPACGRDLLSSAELTVLRYRPGGSYRRHLDDRPGITLGPRAANGAAASASAVRRSLSLLIYLTPDDWSAADGGELRCYCGGEAVDVAPAAGTLVVFDSRSVPHEVLTTRRERLVIAGWLQEAV